MQLYKALAMHVAAWREENGAQAIAIRGREGLNPHTLKYQMIFTSTEHVRTADLLHTQSFMMNTGEKSDD